MTKQEQFSCPRITRIHANESSDRSLYTGWCDTMETKILLKSPLEFAFIGVIRGKLLHG